MTPGLTRRQSLGFFAAAAALATSPAASEGSGPARAPLLRRGVNFHHPLNWPETTTRNGRRDYVWPPFANDVHKTSDDELRRLKALGFDFIRVTVDPSILIVSEGERRQFLADRIRSLVARLNAAGFAVVFDLHPVRVNPAYQPSALVQPGAEAFAAYLRMVGQVATILKDFPPDRIVFELMNEPGLDKLSDAPRWQPMLEALHASARAAAPDLPLMLEGVMWSDRKALIGLDLAPFRSSNVLYTFHYYEPHSFTHQGVENDVTSYCHDLAWPARAENVATVYSQAQQLVAANPRLSAAERADALTRTKFLLDQYLAAGHNAARIRSDFEEVAQWAKRNSIPADRVVLGEFGCVFSSNGRPLGQDRVSWLAAVRQTSEVMGFPWAYWAYKGYGGMELIDPAGTMHQELIGALGLNA